jgi:hypothetical protein
MPVRLRRPKRREFQISEQAVARWREVRPHGIEVAADAGIIVDEKLAEALGQFWLLWTPHAPAIRAELEEIVKCR